MCHDPRYRSLPAIGNVQLHIDSEHQAASNRLLLGDARQARLKHEVPRRPEHIDHHVLALVVLLVHMQPISVVAGVAAEMALAAGDLRGIRIQLVANAGAALLVLLAATTLSVYKPRGLTPYGERVYGRASTTPIWVKGVGAFIGGVLLLFALAHLTGGGLGGHAGH